MLVIESRVWITYNPPTMRRLGFTLSVLILLPVAASSCASTSPDRVIYQQGRTVVQLEADTSVTQGSPQGLNTHPAKIEPVQLASLLRGISVRSDQGFIGTLLSLAVPAEPVFNEEEITVLAPLFAKGLAEATPSQRLAFTYRSSKPGRRNAALSGTIAIKDPYLKFTLSDHPTIGWQDPEDPSAPKLFELEFVRPGLLLAGTEDERKRGRTGSPMLQVNYRRFLQEPERQESAVGPPRTPAIAPASPPEVKAVTPPAEIPIQASPTGPTLDTLQRQIKELMDANEELRAKTSELADQLAETKQLLAEKVLELSRLKSKSGGTKGKPQTPDAR